MALINEFEVHIVLTLSTLIIEGTQNCRVSDSTSIDGHSTELLDVTVPNTLQTCDNDIL